MPRPARVALLAALVASFLAPAAALGSEHEEGPDHDQPDIIVVMVDDLGAIDQRVLKRLPNIRELWLRGGLRFDAFYAETPLCCPGRATFLSGQHTRRHGVTSNAGSVVRAFDQTMTIAVALDGAGYHTVYAGKHLNGMARIDPQPPGWDRVAMMHSWTDQDSTYVVQGETVANAGYRDRYSGQKAVEFLTEAPHDQPIMLWYAPHAPHKFLNTDPAWKPSVEPQYAKDSRCSGITPWKPPSYRLKAKPNGFPLVRVCRSLLTVDDIVGQLRAVAQAQGRDPIWVFTSDNGMAWGAHGYPLKRAPWADRVPLYFAGAGVRKGQTNTLLSAIDLAPTLADLAGESLPWADGQSFSGLLEEDVPGRSWMFQDYPAYPADSGKITPWWSVRQPKWRLINFNGRNLLFNVRKDPWELTDRSRKRADKVAELTKLYMDLTKTLPPAPLK